MIETKELRIRNLVNTPRGIENVVEILRNHLMFPPKGESPYITYPINLIEPIPLTEEWLQKFGFEQHGSGISITYNLTHHLVLLSEKDGFYPYLEESPEMSHQESQTVFLNKIQYIHQLQNLYFALTNTELTYKP